MNRDLFLLEAEVPRLHVFLNSSAACPSLLRLFIYAKLGQALIAWLWHKVLTLQDKLFIEDNFEHLDLFFLVFCNVKLLVLLALLLCNFAYLFKGVERHAELR